MEVLRESNAKLKETVCMLEAVISEMEANQKKEINTYQKIVAQLQKENIELHYKVEALSAANSSSSDCSKLQQSMKAEKQKFLSPFSIF